MSIFVLVYLTEKQRKMIFNKKLEKLVQEEAIKGDLGSRIKRNEKAKAADYEISNKNFYLPTKDKWTNDFLDITVVEYDNEIPNRFIKTLENKNKKMYDQKQLILSDVAIVLRELNTGNKSLGTYAQNELAFGTMNQRLLNNRKLLRCFFNDFLENPGEYSVDFKNKYESDPNKPKEAFNKDLMLLIPEMNSEGDSKLGIYSSLIQPTLEKHGYERF